MDKTETKQAAKQRIYLLSTGGTIEKVYSEQTGAVINDESKIERYLHRLRLPATEVMVRHVMNKDSLDMTDEDREQVYLAVLAALAQPEPIVISHGTDTMVRTGLYLKPRLPGLEVPIILTGAMTPLGFEGTDGLQNLTESLLAARLLPAGIHVVMHNQVFPIGRVRKDRELAQFVWADETYN
jgi:L-asparaginase